MTKTLHEMANDLPEDVKKEIDDIIAPLMIKYFNDEKMSNEEEILFEEFCEKCDQVENYYASNISPAYVQFQQEYKQERIAKRKKDEYIKVCGAHGWLYSNSDTPKDTFKFRLPCADCIFNCSCDLETVEHNLVGFIPEECCQVVNAADKLLDENYPVHHQSHIGVPAENPESCSMKIDISPSVNFDKVKSEFQTLFMRFEKVKKS